MILRQMRVRILKKLLSFDPSDDYDNSSETFTVARFVIGLAMGCYLCFFCFGQEEPGGAHPTSGQAFSLLKRFLCPGERTQHALLFTHSLRDNGSIHTFSEISLDVKCKQLCLRFELKQPTPLLPMITFSLQAHQ